MLFICVKRGLIAIQQNIITITLFFLKKIFIVFKYFVCFTTSYFYCQESSKAIFLLGNCWEDVQELELNEAGWKERDSETPQASHRLYSLTGASLLLRGNHSVLPFNANVLCSAITLVCPWLWLVMTHDVMVPLLHLW